MRQVPFACSLDAAGRGAAASPEARGPACRWHPAGRGPVVSANLDFLLRPQGSKTRPGAYQITLAESRDWMRLWPREDAAGAGFRLVTLPIRLVSLVLLWATSTPGRLLAGVVMAAVAAIALIIR